MRFAFVRLPESGPFEFVLPQGEKPLIFILGRGKQLAVLLTLLSGAAAIFALAHLTRGKTEIASPAAQSPAEPRPMVRPVDVSQPLRPGDFVVTDGTKGPKMRQVAAGPNETVVLRRGNALQALYILGDSGYVVVSENESRLARPEEIRGSIARAPVSPTGEKH
jgi:hypothetical protein